MNPFRRLAPLVVGVVAVVGAVVPGPVRAAEPALLPRRVLFRGVERGDLLVSPDGARLTWIEATNGLPNVWVRSVATNDVRLLSRDSRGPVRQPVWQADSMSVLYLEDSDGLGNWHLMQAHVPTGNIRDLTPFTGVQARLIAVSPQVPHQILVAMNLRDRRTFDAYRLDVLNGATGLEAENGGDIAQWYADNQLNLRLAQIVRPTGEIALATRPDTRSLWRPLMRWGADDGLGRIPGFGPGDTHFSLLSSVRAPAARLLNIDAATGATSIVAEDARFDVASVLRHPASNRVEAVQFMRARAQWQCLPAATNLAADFDALRRFRDADIEVLSRDLADRRWTVSFASDIAPTLFAVYDRTNRQVTPVFSERSGLADAPLAATRPISYPARDGRTLEGYLTLPVGVEPKNLPTVVLVHPGPWSRVVWGFDPEVQWLANRGYAVLQPNFRGSTGYGKEHLDAGNKEWGGKILNDLLDARRWAIESRYADPKRTAIMGEGFGGYAALAALAFHPAEFTAGISLAGRPNLMTMIFSVPATAGGFRAVLDRRVGRLDSDAELLKAQSPASRAAAIQAPLFAATPKDDPQMPLKEMDAFVASIREEGRNVEYLVSPAPGPLLRDPSVRLRLYAAIEAFLGRHLGGRVEPPAEIEKFESLRR